MGYLSVSYVGFLWSGASDSFENLITPVPLTIASNSSFYFIDPMKIYTSTLVVASKNRGFGHMREKSFINIWYDFKWRREVVGGNKWLLRKASCMSYMCCVCETYVGWEMDWFNLNLLSLCCCQRLCFLGFCHFSKKTWVLAARLGARNFTRALGYAKHPLPVLHAYADARLRRRSLTQTLAYADARFRRRTLSQTKCHAQPCSCWPPLTPPPISKTSTSGSSLAHSMLYITTTSWKLCWNQKAT